MADNITFDINAKDNASAALNKVSNNLTKMQKNVQATTSTFEKFRNTLAGLGAIGLVSSTLRWADSIQDLNDATGIATQNILGFSLAVQQNGGTFENAGQAINKFVLSIAEAAQGSAATQQAFAKVGVTLDDLRTLSEQDLLQKTIQGLGQITDVATRAAVQNELLGKSLRGVSIQGVADSIGSATDESAKYAQSIKNAAEVQQKLETSINNLKIALVDVLSPLATLAKDITANIETIKTFIKTLLTVGTVIATFTLVGKVFGALTSILRILSVAGLSVSRVGVSLAATFESLLSPLARFSAGILSVVQKILLMIPGVRKLQTLLQPLIAIIAGAVVGFKLFGDSAEDAGKKAKDGLDDAAKAEKKLKDEADKRAIIDANKKFVESIREITRAYKEANLERLQGLGNEIKYLSMTEEQIALDKNRNAIHKEFMNTLEELGKKREEAALDPNKGAKEIAAIDAEIKKVQESATTTQIESAKKIKEYYKVSAAIKEQKAQLEDLGRAFTQANALQELEEELSLIGLSGDELERQRTILEAQRTLREQLQGLAKQLLELDIERSRMGEDAYNKERQRITQQMKDAQEIADAKINAKERELAKIAELENSYTEGVKKAVKDIAESYKPINVAQDAVKKGWGAIENAVDTFVETGKFKFGDFARSVIADLAKIIAKAAILQGIKAALGAFGFSLPGLASGGPAEGGKPYIVGEKGPELFVPKGSGTVIPNNKLGGANGTATNAAAGPITNNYNTYNINALDAKSVAQLFAENRKAIFGANKMAEREMSYAGAR